MNGRLALALTFFIAMGTLGTPPSRSQESRPESTPADEKTHQELRAMRDSLVEALNKQDADLLLRHVTSDAVLTWQDAQVSRGHQGLRDYFDKMMKGEKRIVESVTTRAETDQRTRLYGPDKDTGVAFGSLEQDFKLTSGMGFHLSSRWTAHVVKEAGTWKVSAFHVSADLFDNPVLAMVSRQVLTWTASVAAPLGFAFGLAAGYFGFRRRGAKA
jgi:ketosteroid isomerase-like protein